MLAAKEKQRKPRATVLTNKQVEISITSGSCQQWVLRSLTQPFSGGRTVTTHSLFFLPGLWHTITPYTKDQRTNGFPSWS